MFTGISKSFEAFSNSFERIAQSFETNPHLFDGNTRSFEQIRNRFRLFQPKNHGESVSFVAKTKQKQTNKEKTK